MDIDVNINSAARGNATNANGSALTAAEKELLDVMLAFFSRAKGTGLAVPRLLLNNQKVANAFNAHPVVQDAVGKDQRLTAPIARLDADHATHLHVDLLPPRSPNASENPTELQPEQQLTLASGLTELSRVFSGLASFREFASPLPLVGLSGRPPHPSRTP